MKKRGRKASHTLKTPSRIVTGLVVLLAAMASATLALISIELAVLSIGILSVAALSYNEARRRNFWEYAASFKFKSLKDNQDMLARETVMNSRDIEDLRQDTSDIREVLAALDQRQSFASMADDAPKPEKTGPRNIARGVQDAVARAPIAAKPAQAQTQAQERNSKPITKPPFIREAEYNSLSDTVVRELLHHAMHEKRVEVFIQPIVRLPQRQVRFYEMFARIRARAGQYLPAARYMEIAEQDNLDGQIDTLLLLHCLKTIQASAHVQKAAPFFINIKNSTLMDRAFMQRVLAFVSQNRDLARRLVFEIRQSDFDAMSSSLLEIMRGLGQLGCSFSLDHVQTLKMNIGDLQHFKIRYVKVAARALIDTHSSERDFAEMHRHKRKLEANGIGVIVERIEEEEQMRELLDYDIHYGQGYLFGKPELEGAYQSRERAKRIGVQERFG